MRRRWTVYVVLVGCAPVVSGWDCGSSAPVEHLHPCGAAGPSDGVPCTISLTGAVDLSFQCTSAYARYDAPANVTSLVHIGASHVPNPANPDAGVSSIDITLAFTGPPVAGAASLVPATPTQKPNAILLFLSDPLMTTYAASDPDGGTMGLTITSAAPAGSADGGPTDLFCLHGNLSAQLPGLYNAQSVVSLDGGF